MASSKKNGSAPETPAQGRKPVRIFVKIGALKRFDALKRKTADLPVVVSWDRRRGERRDEAGSAERGRRAEDRRRNPPFTWELADFVVVEDPAGEQAKKPEPVVKQPAPRRPRRR